MVRPQVTGMTEYIEREALLKFIENGLNNPDRKEAFGYDAVEILEKVQYMPAADVAPVVRCRDCKHCDPENYHCDHPMGTAAPLKRKLDDFCSYGERKDGDWNG